MNQPVHGIPPIPQTPFGTAPTTSASRIEFADGRSAFRRLAMRGALLEFVTIGFYRFWLATDMRRHLWSHTSVEGDAPEYVGTAKDLLIGFLFALAIIVPLNVGYFLLGLEAERLKAFASFPVALVYYLFFQFAIYRARRYRLTRTVWRGVRFSMGGSGLSYCWRAGLWSLFSFVTLGLAMPWRQAALERFKMRYTSYGNLPGRFEATGGQLFKRGWYLWLLSWLLAVAVIAIAAGVAGLMMNAKPSGAEQILWQMVLGLAVLAAVYIAALLAFLFVLPIYRAIEWRWWIAGVRFGDVAFESDLGRGRLFGLYWKTAGWAFLIFIVFLICVSIASGIAYSQAGNGPETQRMLLMMINPIFYVSVAVAYVLSILAFWTATRLYMIHDVWRRVTDSITVHNLASAVDVASQGQMASAIGEGLADSLDIGGF